MHSNQPNTTVEKATSIDPQAISTEPMPRVILGSTSLFRKQLLKKLHMDFTQIAPDIDETPLEDETPREMVHRLSLRKAQEIAHNHPNAIIIASDQTAVFNGVPVGKPHSVENAIKQLSDFSGHCITFYTGLVVINTATQQTYQTLDTTKVYFRNLSENVIRNYIEIEQPLNCAGSFKSEGLGITLFKRIESNDPNALIGLPLIQLTDIFCQMGYPLPLQPAK
ncbi:Maf family protein [Thiomicrorhabdus arctica]|jgi:MAF protein|uniref:Maf family protein n=1 Tax=Thiomicrorhabdus arctica TaxID=131540 RepID=UPI000371B336|nr:nucleoside triphosphate pyrophosphatase [Thiomicrorhabdus arctica]